MTTALIKAQLIVRPISGDVIGLRLKAAESNDGHPIFGPSFAKPYFICEGSDHTIMAQEHVQAFVKWVQSRGYRIAHHGKIISFVLALGQLHMDRAYDLKDDKADTNHDDSEDTGIALSELSKGERQDLLQQLLAMDNRP